MCYSAVPGQTGIRATRDCSRIIKPAKKKPVKKLSKPMIPRRYVATAPVFSGERAPTAAGWIFHELSRREAHRSDYYRGKARRKAEHKPSWHGYEKY